MDTKTGSPVKAIKFYRQGAKWGEFSNFYPSPILLKGVEWRTAEHYFQAQKFAGTHHEEEIRNLRKPNDAARLGRQRSRPLRSDWESVKEGVMWEAVGAKFRQNSALRRVLLSTNGAPLVEHTRNDAYWGDGGDGSGRNRLGHILMLVRAAIVAEMDGGDAAGAEPEAAVAAAAGGSLFGKQSRRGRKKKGNGRRARGDDTEAGAGAAGEQQATTVQFHPLGDDDTATSSPLFPAPVVHLKGFAHFLDFGAAATERSAAALVTAVAAALLQQQRTAAPSGATHGSSTDGGNNGSGNGGGGGGGGGGCGCLVWDGDLYAPDSFTALIPRIAHEVRRQRQRRRGKGAAVGSNQGGAQSLLPPPRLRLVAVRYRGGDRGAFVRSWADAAPLPAGSSVTVCEVPPPKKQRQRQPQTAVAAAAAKATVRGSKFARLGVLALSLSRGTVVACFGGGAVAEEEYVMVAGGALATALATAPPACPGDDCAPAPEGAVGESKAAAEAGPEVEAEAEAVAGTESTGDQTPHVVQFQLWDVTRAAAVRGRRGKWAPDDSAAPLHSPLLQLCTAATAADDAEATTSPTQVGRRRYASLQLQSTPSTPKHSGGRGGRGGGRHNSNSNSSSGGGGYQPGSVSRKGRREGKRAKRAAAKAAAAAAKAEAEADKGLAGAGGTGAVGALSSQRRRPEPPSWLTEEAGDKMERELREQGYTVVEGVLEPQECAAVIDDMWRWVEGQGTGVVRGDVASWSDDTRWPANIRGIVQAYGVGHEEFVWGVRQHPRVLEAFERLWRTHRGALLASFDGVCMLRPAEVTGAWEDERSWVHTDQGSRVTGRDCIQGLVTMEELGEGDATFMCLAGSHRYHASLFQQFGLDVRGDWYKLKPPHVAWLEAQPGVVRTKITAPAGSLVLWDSRTFHCNQPPTAGRPNAGRWRYIVYTCLVPRCLSTADNLRLRRQAFRDCRMTNHNPQRTKLFRTKVFPVGNPRTTPPALGELGMKLAGF